MTASPRFNDRLVLEMLSLRDLDVPVSDAAIAAARVASPADYVGMKHSEIVEHIIAMSIERADKTTRRTTSR